MRKLLNGLYDGSAWLAGIAMIGVLAMVLLTITSRLFGFSAPGTDAYAGYAMAGAGFMALASTLKKGEHIRVTLLLGALKGKAYKVLELTALDSSTDCLQCTTQFKRDIVNEKYNGLLKGGLTGNGYVRLDDQASWPVDLALKLPH